MDLNEFRINNWKILRNYFEPVINKDYMSLTDNQKNNQLLKYFSDHKPVKMTERNIFSWNVADLVNDYNRISGIADRFDFNKFKAEYDTIIDSLLDNKSKFIVEFILSDVNKSENQIIINLQECSKKLFMMINDYLGSKNYHFSSNFHYQTLFKLSSFKDENVKINGNKLKNS